jgi:iron complex transport system ATP-binding protein
MPAVRGVTFDAMPGRITALVGPNGSGKSTIVHALLGRMRPERGGIEIDGIPRPSIPQREFARRVAVIPQREDVVFPMRVMEYVELGRHPHRGLGPTRTLHPVERAVERAGIASLVDRRTNELSGGEWQRVRIARALAQDAPAIVLDEPTTFLDISHEMGAFELLDVLAREGMTVLLVSHQLNLVARFAQHLVLLHTGNVAAAGAPDDVLDPAVLERVYDWPILVSRDSRADAPLLIPLRRGMYPLNSDRT